MKKRFDAILFDLDGTLIHSSPGIFDTLEYTVQQFGQTTAGRDLTPYLGPPLRTIFEKLLEDPSRAADAVDIYRARYDRVGRHMCEPYTGVEPMLNALRENGYILATATCKVREAAEAILKEKGLRPYFDYVGGSTMDGTIETKSQVVQSVIDALHILPQKTLLIGDRIDDMQGAKACGVAAVGVLYGYGSADELKAGNPETIVENCEQLCGLLLE